MTLDAHEARWAKQRKGRRITMFAGLLNALLVVLLLVFGHHWWTWYCVGLNTFSVLCCLASSAYSVRVERRCLMELLDQ